MPQSHCRQSGSENTFQEAETRERHLVLTTHLRIRLETAPISCIGLLFSQKYLILFNLRPVELNCFDAAKFVFS